MGLCSSSSSPSIPPPPASAGGRATQLSPPFHPRRRCAQQLFGFDAFRCPQRFRRRSTRTPRRKVNRELYVVNNFLEERKRFLGR